MPSSTSKNDRRSTMNLEIEVPEDHFFINASIASVIKRDGVLGDRGISRRQRDVKRQRHTKRQLSEHQFFAMLCSKLYCFETGLDAHERFRICVFHEMVCWRKESQPLLVEVLNTNILCTFGLLDFRYLCINVILPTKAKYEFPIHSQMG